MTTMKKGKNYVFTKIQHFIKSQEFLPGFVGISATTAFQDVEWSPVRRIFRISKYN